MSNFLIYLIEATISFAIIYLFYVYTLYKTAYFVWSRWYLLAAIFVSIATPLFPFPFSVSDDYVWSNLLLLNTYSGFGLAVFKDNTYSLANILQNRHFNLQNIILVVYISGFMRALVVFIRAHLKILNTIQHSEIQYFDEYKILSSDNVHSPHSWFKYIFLGNATNLSKKEVEQVIEHEKIHLKQCHSCDLLAYEIFGIFFWFNPLVKRAKQTIRNIHEFIVDSVILQTIEAKEYSKLLLKLSNNSKSSPLVNHLAKNPIIDRIRLIVFPNPLIISKIRFASGVPLLIASLMFYSFVITEINKSTNSLQLYGKYDFVMPVKSPFRIVSPFFEKKQVSNSSHKNKDYRVLVSHTEISIATESNSDVMASRDGIVRNVETVDNWGVSEVMIEIAHNKEFTSIYKGLKKSFVSPNDTVRQLQVIGKTGDKRLYPTISFRLLENNKAVNPMKYINKVKR